MDDGGLVLFGIVFLAFAVLQWTLRNRKPDPGRGLSGTVTRGLSTRPSMTAVAMAVIGIALIIAGF